MKLKLLKTIGSLLFLCVVTFFLYKITLIWNPFAMQKQTITFLRAVQEQNYERAAEIFGREGQETEGNKASAWIQLVEEEGVQLISFSDVRAEYDDGCYCTGHANLVFKVNGEPLQVRAILTFVNGKPKQICAITPSGVQDSIPQLTAWNSLACGNRSF